MVAEGEQEFAEGKWQDSDEMLYELRQERTNMDLTPYTLEELNTRIDRAESQIAAGHISSIEDVLREMDEDFELDEQLGK